eukprot:7385949-Pyramimonas_sp.AAC.1
MLFLQCVSRYRHFELLKLQNGPRGLQDRPMTSQEALEKVPSKTAQEGTKSAQGAPKITQESLKRPKKGNTNPQFELSTRRGPKESPRDFQKNPRGPQEDQEKPTDGQQEASQLPEKLFPNRPPESGNNDAL